MNTLRKSWPGKLAGWSFCLVLGQAICGQAQGQTAPSVVHDDYPAKPIRVVVPFPPGGGADTIARAIAQTTASETGWTFVIENRAGAGGSIGVAQVAKSDADGYTLVMGQTGNLIISPLLYPDLSYDTQRDLQPISLVAESPYMLVASSTTPWHTMTEVVAAARAAPGQLDIGSSGNGTLGHIFILLLQKIAGIQVQYIPYRGVAQALVDVTAGTVGLYAASIPNVKGPIIQGTMRPLAIAAHQRFADFPDVPTLAESGLPGAEADSFHGFLAPRGTPEAIVAKLSAAFGKALQQPALIRRLSDEGAVVVASTPQEFANRIRSEVARWGQVVRETGVRVE